ncbi:MAG: HprK-related kinase A [Planctomycetes bacterium]|nr:HprK-related kinase A [Planctomycetota bacterium]
MRVADLDPPAFRERLRGAGVRLRTGPFVTSLRTTYGDLADAIRCVYADHEIGEGGFADFHVAIVPPRGTRRWIRRQALFLLDGWPLFEPYPGRLTMPLFEWGLNWCVGGAGHEYLILHAAVLERGGRALLMPAKPGVGKSTLCAALAHRGFRLLSDEMALLRPADGMVHPIPRPIGLKEESIEVIRRFVPEAVFGPLWHGTVKGTVAHLRPPADAVRRAREPATPAWIVFPSWRRGAPARFSPHGRADAFLRCADHGLNYATLGLRGFETLAALVERCRCLEFEYGELAEAVAAFERLASEPAAGDVR